MAPRINQDTLNLNMPLVCETEFNITLIANKRKILSAVAKSHDQRGNYWSWPSWLILRV